MSNGTEYERDALFLGVILLLIGGLIESVTRIANISIQVIFGLSLGELLIISGVVLILFSFIGFMTK